MHSSCFSLHGPFPPWILVKQNAKGGRNKGTRNYHYPKSHLNVQIYETVDLAERKTDCTGNNKRDYSNCNFMATCAKSHQILNHKKIKKNYHLNRLFIYTFNDIVHQCQVQKLLLKKIVIHLQNNSYSYSYMHYI